MSLYRVLSIIGDTKRCECNNEEDVTGFKNKDILKFTNHVMEIAIKSEDFKLSKQKGDEEQQKRLLRHIIHVEAESTYSHFRLAACDKAYILQRLLQKMFGFGILQPFIEDESITEVMVNGQDEVYFEKGGKIERALQDEHNPVCFEDKQEIVNIIQRIVAPINRRVDESEPIVDARLPNGSRVNAVLEPISLNGPVMTIRKFPKNPFSMEDLINFGMLTSEVAELFRCLVKAKYNIMISGGTGSGKTTLLNALSQYISPQERIITIEDSAELKIDKVENLIRLETRPPNIEGKGYIGMRELVKTSLRMRPDRIIVGEVRGGEALDMLQAMNTGHDGSITTGHANSATDMLSRLETMVLMSEVELPLCAVKAQIASALDFIIHLGKLSDGSRKVIQICEILDYVNGEIRVNELFKFKSIKAHDGLYTTELAPTGNKILNTRKLINAGITLENLMTGA